MYNHIQCTHAYKSETSRLVNTQTDHFKLSFVNNVMTKGGPIKWLIQKEKASNFSYIRSISHLSKVWQNKQLFKLRSLTEFIFWRSRANKSFKITYYELNLFLILAWHKCDVGRYFKRKVMEKLWAMLRRAF